MDHFLERPSTPSLQACPSEYEYVNTALVSSTSNEIWHGKPSYNAVDRDTATFAPALHQTFAESKLSAIIHPEQKSFVVRKACCRSLIHSKDWAE